MYIQHTYIQYTQTAQDVSRNHIHFHTHTHPLSHFQVLHLPTY